MHNNMFEHSREKLSKTCNGSTFGNRKGNAFAGCARRDFQVRASRDSTRIYRLTKNDLFKHITVYIYSVHAMRVSVSVSVRVCVVNYKFAVCKCACLYVV